MDIDAVQERPADPLPVAQHLAEPTGAFLHRVAIIAAGTGIRRGDQHEISGEGERPLRSTNRDNLVPQQLAFVTTFIVWTRADKQQSLILYKRKAWNNSRRRP